MEDKFGEDELVNRVIVIIILAIVVVAGVGGAFLLTQNNEEEILKMEANDAVLGISALGPGWIDFSPPPNGWAYLPGYYVPYIQHSPPRPNNVAFHRSYSEAFWTNQSYYKFQDYVVVFNTFSEASAYYDYLSPAEMYRNLTVGLNSADEGWYTPDSINPNTTWQYSALRIKNTVAIVSVDSSWMVSPPPPLSEGWFKSLLDVQIDSIKSSPANPDWNPNPPSTLMVGYDDLNRTEPNSWRLSSYYGWNSGDGIKSYYLESFSSGWDSSEIILRLELTEYNSYEAAAREFTNHTGSSESAHGDLDLGDESCYWSSGTLFHGSVGEVAVRKGVRLFIIFWGFNEHGSSSANETQLAIALATLQVSRLP